MPVNPRTPVLVGYGQVNYRETEGPENTPEPIDLMVSAAREAAESDETNLERLKSFFLDCLVRAGVPGITLNDRVQIPTAILP